MEKERWIRICNISYIDKMENYKQVMHEEMVGCFSSSESAMGTDIKYFTQMSDYIYCFRSKHTSTDVVYVRGEGEKSMSKETMNGKNHGFDLEKMEYIKKEHPCYLCGDTTYFLVFCYKCKKILNNNAISHYTMQDEKADNAIAYYDRLIAKNSKDAGKYKKQINF